MEIVYFFVPQALATTARKMLFGKTDFIVTTSEVDP
jgi:hypothetical protein